MRLATHFIIVLLVLVWWYLASLEWRAEVMAEHLATQQTSGVSSSYIPLSAEPQRVQARRIMTSGHPDYARIDSLLLESISRRPLYAPYWLERSEASFLDNNLQLAKDYLDYAIRLWPNRAVFLWKATMMYLRMGAKESALSTIRRYFYTEPGSFRKVMAVASRIEPNTDEMLRTVVPESFPGSVTRNDVVGRILLFSLRSNDSLFAESAWHQLTRNAQQSIKLVKPYTEWMIEHGEVSNAVQAWRAYRDGNVSSLENGGFERKMVGGLDWRVYDDAAFRMERDTSEIYEGQFSLKLVFSGKENINFYHLRQYIPVEQEAGYMLFFMWRGEEVSTRSGVYMIVRTMDGDRLASTEEKTGSWDWGPERVDFTVPQGVSVLEVVFRRKSTDALNNRIRGTVWLDNVGLTKEKSGEQGDF